MRLTTLNREEQVRPEHLEWRHRFPLICDEIGSFDPDVLCMQEVNHIGVYNVN